MLIHGRKDGSDITLINTLVRRQRDSKGKHVEVLTVTYKDNTTGEKFIEEIVDPDYEYYVAKPDKKKSYNQLFESIDNLDKVVVKHNDLEKDIAKRLGMLDYFYDNIRTGNRWANAKLHTHPDLFGSDQNIEDQFRFRFSRAYTNRPTPITKAFFDIEVDGINMLGDFPELGECPINAISLILQDKKEIYSFLLRDKNNPQIDEFEQSVKDGSIYPELSNFIIDAVGGKERANRFGIDQLKVNFLFYDHRDEIHLIMDLFKAINTFRPDFAIAWNMGFDIPYLIARIKALGFDPTGIICPEELKYKSADYYIDERNKNEFAERGDFALITSYTTYLDQLIHFASRRKGQTAFPSLSLDSIGEAIAKVHKLDYKNITTNIMELPRKSFKTFVFYNIMDTVVQYCIEFLTGDLEYVFSKCNLNNTRYSKCHRQTVYLANRGVKEFYKDKFIMGNNVNRFNPPPTQKFPGAFVADMKKISDYSRMRINGIPVNIFDNAIDEDFASLYPSNIRQFNIAPNTQIGMVIIDNPVHDRENLSKDENYVRAGQFMEDYQSYNWLEFTSRWLKLADFTTLYNEIKEFFDMVDLHRGTKRNYGELYYPVKIASPNRGPGLLYQPVWFDDDMPDDIRVYEKDMKLFMELRDHAIKYPNQQY